MYKINFGNNSTEQQLEACCGAEPEFRDFPRRLKRYLFTKRYLFRGQAAQQGFQLFSCRDVG
jgi:hypothetical protein